jgi:uncharacterized protein (TIGR02001 family)
VNQTSTRSSWFVRVVILAALVVGATASAATAQTKRATFTGSIDFPTVYFFRGIRQEADPGFTTFLAGDLGVSLLADGSGGVKTAGFNVGTWNALMTGSSGSDGPQDGAFYESDLYAGFTLGFANSMSVTTMYTAYTSPNDMFKTVHEISFKAAHGSRFAPYALVAFEIGGEDSGQADAGTEKGTYLELGIGPSFPLAEGKATLAIPVKLAFSLNDYYELSGEDEKFGYIDGGLLLTVPLSGGKWNVHGGVNFLGLGDMTAAANAGSDGEPRHGWVIASGGIGVTF